MMRGFSLNAVLAALCLFWAAAVSIAILHLGSRHRPEPDLSLCPLCSRPVPPSQTEWQLHPETP
jgi:hypothetical protein